jgi:diacylglycerol kinase
VEILWKSIKNFGQGVRPLGISSECVTATQLRLAENIIINIVIIFIISLSLLNAAIEILL